MPITQIPFQDPATPPPKEPEQMGLYDQQEWETAYRAFDDDARVPHLLIQLQDDLARSRKREAAWISIIAHLIIIILIWNWEAIDKHFPWVHALVVSVQPALKNQNVTFLLLAPDTQKVDRKPKTNIVSDKDRIATSRHPELDPKELRKLLASPPPGAPAAPGQPGQQPAPTNPAVAQGQQAAPSGGLQQNNPNLTAQLQIPAKPKNDFSKYAGSMSAGSAIQQAARGAAAAKQAGAGGDSGDYGLGIPQQGRPYGTFDILSDTQGVDFGPYLARITHDIRENWIRIIPESAMQPIAKKGKLTIVFAIMKDGKVAGMKLEASSTDTSLDRAAWGGITNSNPFPPLPSEFTGPYLMLRCRFYYNFDKDDLE